jgi:hypothetical protein
MDTILSRKIEETRASIEALSRQAEGVQRQIEIQKIKLQAYMELAGDSSGNLKKPVVLKKPAVSVTRSAPLFISTLPWNQAFASLKKSMGGQVFGAEHLLKEFASLGHTANVKTARWKLRLKADAGELLKVGDGRYKFPLVPRASA